MLPIFAHIYICLYLRTIFITHVSVTPTRFRHCHREIHIFRNNRRKKNLCEYVYLYYVYLYMKQ